jgi:PAS domain S-box-containing protein
MAFDSLRVALGRIARVPLDVLAETGDLHAVLVAARDALVEAGLADVRLACETATQEPSTSGASETVAIELRGPGSRVGRLSFRPPRRLGPAAKKHLRELAENVSVAWRTLDREGAREVVEERARLAALDLTRRHETEAALRTYASAIDAAANGVVITDARGTIELANSAFCALTGYSEHEIVGSNMRMLRSGKNPPELYATMWATIARGEVWRGELVNRRKDGSLYDEEMTITPIRDERGQATHFVAIKQDVTDRKRAEARLRQSQERYRTLVDNLDDVVFSIDPEGAVTFVSRAVSSYGYRPEELVGRSALDLVHPEDRDHVREVVSGEPIEVRLLDAEGRSRFARLSLRVLSSADGAEITGVAIDLTARRETEEQLRAAQKMEAVGRLAGGIAHDFNNLMSVILSYTELVLGDVPEHSPMLRDLEEVESAARRAARLTRQLLAFSRRQEFALEAVDLGTLVGGMQHMLGRLIGEDVDLTFSHAPGDAPLPVLVDPGQIEQVVMNLVVNARDALPDGGSVTVRTGELELGGARAQKLGLSPGRYACLTVDDSGCGMDEPTRARIFEPFFTTKGVGKGTGLGLSMVYGIVRQSHGAIEVDSQPKLGTTFRILLPLTSLAAVEARGSVPPPPKQPNKRTILVVEDEPALREVIRRGLSELGYEPLVAPGPSEALRICEHEGERIDLVLTDVVMPGMNGRDLAERIGPLCRKARVLFMSGYTDETIERHGVLGRSFLRKPFDKRTLARRLEDALE